MKIFAALVILITNSVIIQSNNEYDNSTVRNEEKKLSIAMIRDNEEKCYAYCFNIIQPVLEHTVKIQLKDQQIQEQAITLKQLENQIADYKMRLAIYEETIRNKDQQFTQQLTISEKLSNETIDLKKQVEMCEENIKNKDQQLTKQLLISEKCQNETRTKDELLSKTNENLIEYKVKLGNCQAPNCVGKVTDIYEIKVPGIDAFSVPCDSSLAGSGWTVIQRRMDGSVDFNRNWTDYRQGFGDLSGEFFIGLDKLHLITKSQMYELYIYLKDFDDIERYATYNKFYIGGKDEFYKIKSLGSYSGDAGDSMENHLNMQFSTPEDGGCAESFKSGWWFYDCYMCNLNGFYTNVTTSNDTIMEWRTWHTKPLKFVQMMIRPN